MQSGQCGENQGWQGSGLAQLDEQACSQTEVCNSEDCLRSWRTVLSVPEYLEWHGPKSIRRDDLESDKVNWGSVNAARFHSRDTRSTPLQYLLSIARSRFIAARSNSQRGRVQGEGCPPDGSSCTWIGSIDILFHRQSGNPPFCLAVGLDSAQLGLINLNSVGKAGDHVSFSGGFASTLNY